MKNALVLTEPIESRMIDSETIQRWCREMKQCASAPSGGVTVPEYPEDDLAQPFEFSEQL
jgi:hypothetical protein